MTEIVEASGALLEELDLLLAATFYYNSEQPVGVMMTLIDEGGDPTDQITWEFSRSLLGEAFSKPWLPIGLGDVTVSYHPERQGIKFELTDVYDDKHSVLVNAAEVNDFLLRTYVVVPAGMEAPEVDAAIAKLLA